MTAVSVPFRSLALYQPRRAYMLFSFPRIFVGVAYYGATFHFIFLKKKLNIWEMISDCRHPCQKRWVPTGGEGAGDECQNVFGYSSYIKDCYTKCRHGMHYPCLCVAVP